MSDVTCNSSNVASRSCAGQKGDLVTDFCVTSYVSQFQKYLQGKLTE